MHLSTSPRVGPLLIATIVGALTVAVAVALLFFGMRGKDLVLVGLYLFLSGSISLAVAYGAFHLVLKSPLKMRHKIALAGAMGGLIALANVLVTAVMMFLSSHDLTLLIVLLVFSLIVSLLFAFILAGSISASLELLSTGAKRLGQGDLSVRINVASQDEIADLANVLNSMAQDLDTASRLKQELEQARKDLVASVSHDLRTPLASIQAMVEAMEDGVVSYADTIKRYLSAIRREVEQLSALINDLFELSRLDSGTLELHLRPSSVQDIVASALESMNAQASQKELTIESKISRGLGPVLVDRNRIQRVLHNLIQNAIRHTPSDGTVLVEAQDQGPMVQIDVADTGQGISQEDLGRVFERFYRGEKSRSRDFGGSGLGLAIAKGIVEAHGGWIQVSSTVGEGSRFSFCLPKARPSG